MSPCDFKTVLKVRASLNDVLFGQRPEVFRFFGKFLFANEWFHCIVEPVLHLTQQFKEKLKDLENQNLPIIPTDSVRLLL